MKVLIWLGGLFLASLITTLLTLTGNMPGGAFVLILYLLVFVGIRALCKAWDGHVEQKKADKAYAEKMKAEGKPIEKANLRKQRLQSVRRCGKCDAPLEEGAGFCPKCGAPASDAKRQ